MSDFIWFDYLTLAKKMANEAYRIFEVPVGSPAGLANGRSGYLGSAL